MTKRKNDWGWLIQCCVWGCLKEFKHPVKTYQAAKEAAKREGWMVDRGGKWTCPKHS